MFVLLSSIQNDNAVISISSNGEKIALLDTHNTLHIYDRTTLERKLKKRLVKIQEPKELYHRGSTLSVNMDIFISSKESGSAALVNLQSSPILKEKFNYNKRAIYYSLFNHDSTLLAFGGEDGKFYVYDQSNAELSSLIETQSDYISAITFSRTKRFIAISSFNKKTIIYDTIKHKEVATIEQDIAVEVLSFSDDDSTLLLLSRKKTMYKYLLETQELQVSSFDIDGWATAIVMLEDEFCVVSTRSNKLYLINHKKFTLVGTIEFEKSGITQLHKEGSLLLVSFIDGELMLIDMHAYLDEFTMHLSLHEFQRARGYLEYNLFLHTSKAMKVFDIEWEKILEEAKALLAQNNQTQADKIVEPFLFDEQKREEYESFKCNSPIYKRFLIHIEAFRYGDAYNLVELNAEHSFLKTTKEYKRLEKEWFFLYKECKSMLMKDDEMAQKEAKRRLQPFMRIASKRDLIVELLKNYKIFQRSDAYVRSRNFKAYFGLVAEYTFLEMEEVYKKVLEIGQSTYTRLIDFEQNLKLDEAIEIARFLLDFTPMHDEVAQTLERLQLKKELQSHCQNHNTEAVYTFISKYPSLENSKIFETFHQIFLEKLEELKRLSQEAQVQKMLSLVRAYIGFAYTRETLGYYFRQAYIKEIVFAYKSEDAYLIDFEKTIEHFYSYFGRHSDIFTNFFNAQISESVLQVNEKHKYPEDSYLQMKFPGTILKKI